VAVDAFRLGMGGSWLGVIQGQGEQRSSEGQGMGETWGEMYMHFIMHECRQQLGRGKEVKRWSEFSECTFFNMVNVWKESFRRRINIATKV